MTHKDYNGWTNYETWCIHLWLEVAKAFYDPAHEADLADG